MAAAAGAAIVVVPLTGAAAAALVATEPAGNVAHVTAASSLSFATATEEADVPAVVAEAGDAEIALDAPDVKVKKNPEPEPEPAVVASTNSSRSTSSTRPVANSASVEAAISGSAVIAEASKYVGTPYARGGSTPAAFDCSGFVSYVYGQLGVSLPRSSGAYYNVGTRVSSPQPGDIIVTPGHVGIYAGPNLQIDASTHGIPVRFHAMWQEDPVYIRVN